MTKGTAPLLIAARKAYQSWCVAQQITTLVHHILEQCTRDCFKKKIIAIEWPHQMQQIIFETNKFSHV